MDTVPPVTREHDRPLAGEPHPEQRLHWTLYGCEAVAMAVLMVAGITWVTVMLAPHSPLARFLAPHPALRIALCGFGFGLCGTVAAHTPFGRVSGAHVNPSVTLGFLLAGKLKPVDALGYMGAQLVGGLAGTAIVAGLGLLVPGWGRWTGSVRLAATVPNPAVPIFWPFAAELCATFGLIFMLYWLASHPWWRWFTPWAGGVYFLLTNPLAVWLSGNSTNLFRSLAPAAFTGAWGGFWVYVAAPFIGSAAAVGVIRSRTLVRLHLPEARLINFGHGGRVPPLRDPTRKPA
ncbi:MAG: aquaporin [Gluconacetobacter diazotrophicus]|nr:aquaporin [Gluconacetobacter diazotrophicus]